MQFANHTPYPAKFLTGSTGEKEIVGIVVCKVTYRLGGSKLVPVTGEDAWPVFDKPFEFEGLSLMPETDFRKRGVDILVVGTAVAPEGKPVPWMRVAAECGRVCHQVAVFGDRVWKSGLTGLTPSDPAPFVEMPLTNDRAFGGTAVMADAEIVHPVNPEGRGFIYEKEYAEGTPLPNLEDPDALIVEWGDKPRPACWFKPTGPHRAKNAPDFPPNEIPAATMRASFNQTVPELVAEPDQLGDTLRLVGFSPDGDMVFPMPALEGPAVEVHVGDLKGRFPASLSTLVALPKAKALVATYRSLFRYLMHPQEVRRADLRWPGNERDEPALSEGDES